MRLLQYLAPITCAAALAAAPALSAQHAAEHGGASRTASATLKTPGGKTIGQASLRETPHGVLVHLKMAEAPDGTRAVHLHTTGRCEGPAFESAGGHFNPKKATHGFASASGPHVGDLPNLHIPDDGTLEVEFLARDATLGADGLADADGSAIVLHAGTDDYMTDPAGNAGDRIACGVIQPDGGK